MGHYCGAPNTSKPGTCGRWLVNYANCAPHRGSGGGEYSVTVTTTAHHTGNHSEGAAELMADALVDGLDKSVADRVTDYLGAAGARAFRYRRWDASACQALANTAAAVLRLKDKAHSLVGTGIGAMLPASTPRFHRKLVERIASKIPLPWDVKLEAIARALQVLGIFECFVKNLPMTDCACLRMLGAKYAKDQVSEHVKDLIDETGRDLRGEPPRPVDGRHIA